MLSSDGPSVGGEFPGERGQAAGPVIPEDDLWLILNLLKVGGSQEVDVPGSVKVVDVIVLSRVMMQLLIIDWCPFIELVSWDLWLLTKVANDWQVYTDWKHFRIGYFWRPSLRIAPIPSGTLAALLKRLQSGVILGRRLQPDALESLHRETLRAALVLRILPDKLTSRDPLPLVVNMLEAALRKTLFDKRLSGHPKGIISRKPALNAFVDRAVPGMPLLLLEDLIMGDLGLLPHDILI